MKNTAASCGTRKGEVANWANTNVPALRRQKLSSWKSCCHPFTSLEAWPCFSEVLKHFAVNFIPYILSPLTCLCNLPCDIYHVFPSCLTLERTLHSRHWPNTKFCLITNPLPHAHVHEDRVLFIWPEHLWLCWPQPRGWDTAEERMPLLNSCGDSGISTCHCA